MYNLENSFDRARLSSDILKDIEAACVEKLTDGPRKHLGASVIGDPCEQKSWLIFRWARQETFTGQKLRLFNRGHEEEVRFIRWLEWAGFTVWALDPETDKQIRIVGSNGHFGGSLDSVIKFPTKYGLLNLVTLGEFKTHNEKNFNDLQNKKVALSKPKHYKQMCSYGKFHNFHYGLYAAVNKNTDELYIEIAQLDFSIAEDLYRKADNIINSQQPRQKVANSKTYFDCKYCHFSGICYDNEVPTKNCRSCIRARPIENGQWWCEIESPTNGPIPDKVIKTGCDKWTRII